MTGLLRDDETRDLVAATPWLEDVAHATVLGRDTLRVRGRYAFGDGTPTDFDVYIDHVRPFSVEQSVHRLAFQVDAGDELTPASAVDRDAAWIGSLRDVEAVTLLPCLDMGTTCRVSLTVGGAGRFDEIIDEALPLERTLRVKTRYRRQDAEGRTIAWLGAAAVGLAAEDAAEAELILDTLIVGGHVARFRGMGSALVRDKVNASWERPPIRVVPAGIEIHELAATMKAGLHGRAMAGRRLSELVSLPGIDHLRIRRATRRAVSASGMGLLFELADGDMAELPPLERDEALALALETLAARRAAGTA